MPALDGKLGLERLLKSLGNDQHLILNLCNAEHLDQAFVGWLWRTCQRHDGVYAALQGRPHQPGRLFLALSCHPETPYRNLLINIETFQHFDVRPLTEKQLKAVLDRRFHPHALSAGFIRSLHSYASLAKETTLSYPVLLANAVHELLASDMLQNPEGVWKLNPDISAEEISAHLSQPLDEAYLHRLEQVPHQFRSKVDRLLQLGALCGETIPAAVLLDYMGISDVDAQDALIDQLDEHLVETSPPLLKDHAFTHPGFQQILIYRFTQPLLPILLRNRLDKQAEARQLLEALASRLPAHNHTISSLFLNLAMWAGEAQRVEWQQRLSWWIGYELAQEWRDQLLEQLKEGHTTPEALLNIVSKVAENLWPLYRSKAVLDACRLYYRATGGVPYILQGASFLSWRGLVLHNLGKYRVAEANHRRALAIRRGLLTEHHPDIAASLNNIGNVLYGQNRLDEALEHYQEALVIQRQALPEHHPDIARSLNNIGSVLRDQNHLDEALKHQQEALEIWRQALPEHHPDIATSLSHIGSVLQDQNRLDEALEYYQEALKIFEKSLGSDHPNTITVRNNYRALREQLDHTQERSSFKNSDGSSWQQADWRKGTFRATGLTNYGSTSNNVSVSVSFNTPETSDEAES